MENVMKPYQEAEGRTSWDQSSKQCLKSSIIIAGSQGSPMRTRCLLGGGTGSIPCILSSSRSRASNAVVGLRRAGLPKNKDGWAILNQYHLLSIIITPCLILFVCILFNAGGNME